MYLKDKTLDAQLARMLKNNNINAFEELFEMHHKAIYTRTYTIVESKKETEAIVEKIFIDLWENRFCFDENIGSFRSFLYKIADKCLSNHIKEKLESEMTKNINLQEA